MARKAKNPMVSKNSKEMVVSKQEIEHYSGIIPHPNIVEGYEKICPGAADRILAMTENELKNKQELERMEQENILAIPHIKASIFFIIFISFNILYNSFYCIFNNLSNLITTLKLFCSSISN